MEGASGSVIKLNELIGRRSPVTGALSLSPSGRPGSFCSKNIASPLSDKKPKVSGSTDQNPNPKILQSLNHPTMLIGTLNLPVQDANPNSNLDSFCCSRTSCFSFSDGSLTVCCDVLDLDVHMIGKTIHVLSWNFIPFDRGGGFLEIIEWSFPESTLGLSRCSSNFNTFPLFSGSVTDRKLDSKAQHCVHGVLESVGPVSVVSCQNDVTLLKSDFMGKTTNLCGFLVQIRICKCRLCSSVNSTSALKNLTVERNRHCFSNGPMIVYFHGWSSCWHPVLSKLVKNFVSLSGLTKKMVFIGREESQLVYMITEKTLLHLPNSSNPLLPERKTDMKGNGEIGIYMGTITGVYMQGMIVELDYEVLLLLTDQQLDVPHSLRIGAFVSAKNVHFVTARFSWMKALLLGSCCKTTINIKSFSPIETQCYLGLQSQSLLRKFINSLIFPARLWALLVIQCFRKKFAGMLSEKEILGSKHKEGLAQAYARSHLPLSVFLTRHGVFMEYCRHEFCGFGSEQNYGNLKLVVPISSFISHCQATWIKILLKWDTDGDVMGVDMRFNVSCEGISYRHLIKRTMRSEDLDVVLLGKLEVCLATGRLQLTDVTGSIDVLFQDLSSNWCMDSIYEIDEYATVIEGMPEKLDYFQQSFTEPFSYRSIFNEIPMPRQVNLSLYLCCFMGEKQHKNKPFYSENDLKDTVKKLEGGNFHLLLITHKFPVLQKFRGVKLVSSNPSAFVEAMILPWELFIPCNDELSMGNNKNFGGDVSNKKRKIEQVSRRRESFDLNNYLADYCSITSSDLSYLHEIPCLISWSDHSLSCSGILRYAQSNVKGGSNNQCVAWKVLLEYHSESFSKFESLRIGGCYVLKLREDDSLCSIRKRNDRSGRKVVMTSEMHLWSVSFSLNKAFPETISSPAASFHGGFVTNNDVLSNDSHETKFPFIRNNCEVPEMYFDIHLNPSADITIFLTIDNLAFEGLPKPPFNLEEMNNIAQCNASFVNPSAQSSILSLSDSCLHEGSLVSLHGFVLAVHTSENSSFTGYINQKSFAEYCSIGFTQRGTNGVCIHILANHQMAKILGASTVSTYPTGFGTGVYAHFHRILVLGGKNEYALIPASFIVVKSVRVANDEDCYERYSQPFAIGLQNVASSDAFPVALICEMKQGLDFKLTQFHCQVVSVYLVVMERAAHPSSHMFNIPLAGFIIDDGSSSCCCWTNSERAATLLRLHEPLPHMVWSNTEIKGPQSSTMSRIDEILRQHGKIVVKNCGPMFDRSHQDLTVSVGPDTVLSSSDESFLKSILFKASFGNSKKILGFLMNSNAIEHLDKCLNKLGMATHSYQNIWASEISDMDNISLARNMIQEL